MLLRVLISVLLLAVYMPGVYGDGDTTAAEGLIIGGDENIGSNSTDDKVDYSDISDTSSSNDISEINSSEIVNDVVTTYAEDCEDVLNWDINNLVDSFANCFEGFPD